MNRARRGGGAGSLGGAAFPPPELQFGCRRLRLNERPAQNIRRRPAGAKPPISRAG